MNQQGCSKIFFTEELRNLRSKGLHTLIKNFAGCIDFFLTSQEYKDISGRFCQMNLHHCN